MGRYRRADSVEGLVRREVSDIIRSRVKDPRIGFVTVTAVRMSDDLRYAKVYVSILGDERERGESLRVLERASGFIRGELGRRIRMRHVPEIGFQYDNSMEYGARIDEILRNL